MTTKSHGPLIHVETWFTTSPEEILRATRPAKPLVVVTRRNGEEIRRRVRPRPA